MRSLGPWITSMSLAFFLLLSHSEFLFAQTIDFGRYEALLIANQKYIHWKPLASPHRDVDELAHILANRYGFKVKVLKDVTRKQIIDELERYRKRLTRHDNFLIYYAGHGKLRKDGGYWIGVDAQKESRSGWLHYQTISDLIDANNDMQALHVLVIADSCYAGAVLRRDDDAIPKRSIDEAKQAWLLRMRKTASRTALTSGGTEPVIDSVGFAENSIFAIELINRLKNNNDVLETDSLYELIKKDVHARGRRIVGNDAQAPEYGAIPGTGHGGGDFLFVPKGRLVYVKPPELDAKTDFGIKGGATEGQLKGNVSTTLPPPESVSLLNSYKIAIYVIDADADLIEAAQIIEEELSRKLREYSVVAQVEVRKKSREFFEETVFPPKGLEIRYEEETEERAAKQLRGVLKEIFPNDDFSLQPVTNLRPNPYFMSIFLPIY